MLIPEGHWACAVVMPYRRVRFWGWNSSTSLPAYRSITITPPLMIIITHDMFRNNTTTLHRVNLINIQQTHWSNSCSIAWSLHTFDLWSGVLWNVAVAIISSIVTLFPSVFFQKSTNRAERSAGGSEKTPHRPWNYTQLPRAFKNPWPQISKHTHSKQTHQGLRETESCWDYWTFTFLFHIWKYQLNSSVSCLIHIDL